MDPYNNSYLIYIKVYIGSFPEEPGSVDLSIAVCVLTSDAQTTELKQMGG